MRYLRTAMRWKSHLRGVEAKPDQLESLLIQRARNRDGYPYCYIANEVGSSRPYSTVKYQMWA